jgi:hypothetical protein
VSAVAKAVAPVASGAEAVAAPAAPSAAADAADPAAQRSVEGGSRSTLFGGDSPNRSGGSRQTIIHRPDDAQEGGLLAGTPIGPVLDEALTVVSQAVPLPVDVTVSVPGVTGPLDAPLSATVQLPAGQSVAVQVPSALTSVLGGVLQPVSGLLSGLTAP